MTRNEGNSFNCDINESLFGKMIPTFDKTLLTKYPALLDPE